MSDDTAPQLSKEAAARQLLAQRVLARRRLLYFTKLTHPSYQPGWVHEDICRRLERFSQQVAERKSPRLLLMMPPRHGKSLADSTPMLTANRGWTTHGQLQPGDFVFAPDGTPTKVLAVGPAHEVDREVEFSDGSILRAHAQHEWHVLDSTYNQWLVRETQAIEPIATTGGAQPRARFQVAAPEPLHYADSCLPIDPYTLGVWLGDGTTTKNSIACAPADRAVLDAVAEVYGPPSENVHSKTGCIEAYFKPLYGLLRDHGLLGRKHIPKRYLTASVEQREALLAGLVDTDGHVDRVTGRVRISTCCPELRDGVVALLRTLGVRCGVNEVAPRVGKSGFAGRRPVFVIGFQPRGPLPTVLARKQPSRFVAPRRLSITAVRTCASESGRCIQVARGDGLYLAGRTLIPTHNSELASIRFPAWHLGQHPHHEIINVGYNLDLPMKFSRKVREIVRDGSYAKIFPEATIDPDSQSVEAWNMTKGGGFTAAGVGGGITGKGAHILIIDDPIKNIEEADSADVRDKLEEWYQSTAYTRLAPGGGVLMIETWWNDDDLAGRVQQRMAADKDADQFEIVRYPALSEAWEYRDEASGDILRFAEEQPPTEGITLLRPKDFCLHEERYSTQALKGIRANMEPRLWSALFQQNPVPDEGMYFRKEYFRYLKNLPDMRGCRIYTAWDFAIGEKQQNDWTVGATVMQDQHDCLYVLEVFRLKGDAFALVDAILNCVERWGMIPQTDYLLGFEDGQIFKAIEPLLKKRMSERNITPAYETMKPLTDKLARARPLQGRMQHGRVYFPEGANWLAQAQHEMLRFPGGVHDDVVDALAWATRLCMGKPVPTAPEAPRLHSWKDRLNDLFGGNGTHMSA